VLAATILAGSIGTGPAFSATPSQFDVDFTPDIESQLRSLTPEQYARVERTAALDPVLKQFEPLPGFVDGGYLTSTSPVVEVMWHGSHTPELEGTVAKLKQKGVEVQVSDIVFTIKESRELIRIVSKALDRAEIEWDSVGPDLHLTEIEVTVLGPDVAKKKTIELINDLKIGVPVLVTNVDYEANGDKGGEPLSTTAESRVDDTGSLEAAMTTVNYNPSIGGYGYCTTALSYRRAGYGDYQLQAGHCNDFTNDLAVQGANSDSIGTSRALQIFWGTGYDSDSDGPRLDAEVIELPTRLTTTKMWTGAWNTQTKNAVNGTSSIPYSTALCGQAEPPEISATWNGPDKRHSRASNTRLRRATLACVMPTSWV